MISFIITVAMIILFIFSGRVFEGVKRLITLLINLFLKICKLFGLNIERHERRVKTSDEFKSALKDIKIVKKSKQNNKMKKSINITSLILVILSLSLIVINLGVVSDNIISKWLYTHNPLPFLIVSQSNMDVTFTAIVFSVMSFSASSLFRQWVDTKEYRKERKRIKEKQKLIQMMSSKEMLDMTKAKDKENLSAVLHIESEDGENV